MQFAFGQMCNMLRAPLIAAMSASLVMSSCELLDSLGTNSTCPIERTEFGVVVIVHVMLALRHPDLW